MPEITAEDIERVELLEIVSDSKIGLKLLSKNQLEKLYELIEKKNYSHDSKINESKAKLLEKINNRLYDMDDGRVIL